MRPPAILVFSCLLNKTSNILPYTLLNVVQRNAKHIAQNGFACIKSVLRLLEIVCLRIVVHIEGYLVDTGQRMQDALGSVNAETILTTGVPKLQGLGMTFRKAEYITDFAEKVHTGAFDLNAVERMNDEDAIRELSSLKGIGVWTAEMILLFCMQRPDILSFHDLAIQRGLRMVYHHRSIDRKLFEKYRRRFHPYCSVASLYLWAVSGGAIPEMKDFAPKKK